MVIVIIMMIVVMFLPFEEPLIPGLVCPHQKRDIKDRVPGSSGEDGDFQQCDIWHR